MMKSIRNRSLKIFTLVILMLSILFSMMPAMSAHAVQGKTGIYFSSNSVKVGDSVQVTVTGTGIDQIRVTYTAGLLNLTGCSAPGYTASGSTISFLGNKAVLTFSAQKAGSAEIVVRANVSTGSSALMKISDPAAQSQTTEQKAETNAATTNGSDQQGSNQTAQPANGSDQNGSNQTASPANGTDQNTQNGQTEDPKQSTTSDGETTTQKAGNESDSDEKAAPEKKTGIMETIQNALSALKDKIANIDPNTKLRILLVAGAVVVILLILCILSMFRHRKEDRESDPFDDDFRMDDEDSTEESEPAGGKTNTESGETEPGETEPVETEPGETKPGETKPRETKSRETEPKAKEPKATEPRETEPKDTKSGDTEPASNANSVKESSYRTISGMELDDHLDDELEEEEYADTTLEAEPSESVEPAEPAEVTEASEPAEATEATEPAKPEEPAESTEATEPTKPAEPTEATEPAEPSEPSESVEPAKPTESTEATEPAKPTEPAEATESIEATEPAESTEATEPAPLQLEAEDEEDHTDPSRNSAGTRRSFFHRKKDLDIWEDDDQTPADPIRPVNHEKMIENARKRKKKLGGDNDFMDLNDF